jgi:hypothetical protein
LLSQLTKKGAGRKKALVRGSTFVENGVDEWWWWFVVGEGRGEQPKAK